MNPRSNSSELLQRSSSMVARRDDIIPIKLDFNDKGKSQISRTAGLIEAVRRRCQTKTVVLCLLAAVLASLLATKLEVAMWSRVDCKEKLPTASRISSMLHSRHPVPDVRGLPDYIANSAFSAATTPASRWGLGTRRSNQADPSRPLADPVAIVESIDVSDVMMASPSIIRLSSGRLLVVNERVPRRATNSVSMRKHVSASDDGGATWIQVGTLGPMWWPQVFQCASGVYVIGNEGPMSSGGNNNLFISKMLDEGGSRWTDPTQISFNMSVVTANQGVEVSNGHVIKPFEVIPALAHPAPQAQLSGDVQVPLGPRPSRANLRIVACPVVTLPMLDGTDGFLEGMFIRAMPAEGTKAIYLRVLQVDAKKSALLARVELVNRWVWPGMTSITLPAGSNLTLSPSGMYAALDWYAVVLVAAESADLTLPASWHLSNSVGNPAVSLSGTLHDLLASSFRADAKVQNAMLGFKNHEFMDEETAMRGGIGTVRWMEGWPIRMRHTRGNGQVRVILRISNDIHCSFGAVVDFNDTDPAATTGVFKYYGFLPGMGIAHPAVVYDDKSDLYWMVSNINRDGFAPWNGLYLDAYGLPKIESFVNTSCEVDRSSLGLYYSANLLDWMDGGLIDYTWAFHRHFTYPSVIIDGDDLLIVTRAAIGGDELHSFYNNHNSNSIAFHRVRAFRGQALMSWMMHSEAYDVGPHIGSDESSTGDFTVDS